MSTITQELTESWNPRVGNHPVLLAESGDMIAIEYSQDPSRRVNSQTGGHPLPQLRYRQLGESASPSGMRSRRLAQANSTPLSREDAAARLTSRELEVLSLAATGATDQIIADALFIARRTVTSHMANILSKLNAGNRTAAAVCAARSGLI